MKGLALGTVPFADMGFYSLLRARVKRCCGIVRCGGHRSRNDCKLNYIRNFSLYTSVVGFFHLPSYIQFLSKTSSFFTSKS